MKQVKKLLAFTLAETLIVIGIIGVVSALTLPNLNSSTGDKEKVVKVKKVYQNFDDALGRATAVYGPMTEWIINDSNATAQTTRVGERLSEFMKLSKTCGMTANSGCFTTNSFKSIAGGEVGQEGSSASYYKFILADGTAVSLSWYGSGASVIIDIDGPNKGKHTVGIDTFSFRLNPTTGSVDLDTPDLSTLLTTGTGKEAATWVINFDNMEYMKADSSGKCKNNTSRTLNAFANPPVISCK